MSADRWSDVDDAIYNAIGFDIESPADLWVAVRRVRDALVEAGFLTNVALFADASHPSAAAPAGADSPGAAASAPGAGGSDHPSGPP